MGKKFVLINLREVGKIIMSCSLWVNKNTTVLVSGVRKATCVASGQLTITNVYKKIIIYINNQYNYTCTTVSLVFFF